MPTPPPAQGQDEVLLPEGPTPLRRAVLRLTAPFSLLSAPVVALPTRTPFVGAQLIAPHGQDDRLLGLAQRLERTLETP